MLDFTKDYSPRADQETQQRNLWGVANITSSEYTFEDDGNKNKKLTHVWVKREDEEPEGHEDNELQ